MTVQVGHDVSFRDISSGSQDSFRLVPAGEGNVAHKLLAEDSPVARALIGHERGETVSVVLPRGIRQLLITAVTP
jgi:transcription elongation factor GreA